MGMDMYFIKLKDNSKYKANLTLEELELLEEDVGIDEFLDRKNYYYDRGFEDSNLEFGIIDTIKQEMNSDVNYVSDLVSNQLLFYKLVDVVNEWYKTKWNSRTVFSSRFLYGDVKFTRMPDLVEYLNCAKNNQFTLYFSF